VKDYYNVLDIPVTATLDEIKAQYKRLVRIYHPDRFSNSFDKVYAEHKLKELNEAYAVLSANARSADDNEPSRPMPIPIAEPAVLEFGSVAVGQRQALKFKVGNAGGPTKNISFVYHDDHAWYSITRVRQIYPDKSFPVEIEVILNPHKLQSNRKYQSWFDVNMDGATSRIELSLQTKQQATSFQFLSHRLALVTATCLMIIALTLAVPWARSLTVAFGLPAVNPITPTQLNKAVENGTNFSLQQNSSIAKGWEPVFSPDRRQMALISDQLGTSQIFVRDPLTGRLRQVTHSVAEKSALTWSPDGRQLAFITHEAGRTVLEIFAFDQNENNVFTPTIDAGEITDLLWTSDGESIFLKIQRAEQQQYYRATVKNQQFEQVTAPESWQ
jgi:DnaJ domain/WD40-like Beta Propeller Repeat